MHTTKFLRHVNAIKSLRLLHDGRALSRAEIARELGLTRATIGNAMTALVDAGYILEGETNPTEGRKGRPGVAIALNPEGAYFIGIDIGTRALIGVVIDLRMQVVARIAEPTGPRFRDADYMLERLLELLERLIGAARIDTARIEGLCVSVPGLVARDGSVVNAPFLEWRDYPLRSHLERACPDGWMVTVCNDAFALASAEASGISAAATDSTLLVLMAEGIGGAIVEAGRPMNGAHGYAGEIGHMLIAAGGRVDTFEMLAGAKSFAGLLDPAQTVAEGIAAMLASLDDPKVARALDAWAEALAAGLANAIHLLDPGQIILGGPTALLYPPVAEKVQAKLAEKLLAGFESVPIMVARYGADGAAIGAAATIRDALFTLPNLD